MNTEEHNTIKCPHCGVENDPGRSLCINCAKPLREEQKSALTILRGPGYIIGGIILVAANETLVLHILPIPGVLFIIGALLFLMGCIQLVLDLVSVIQRKKLK
jgi:hypothetical protein